jgi:hypothetical protein
MLKGALGQIDKWPGTESFPLRRPFAVANDYIDFVAIKAQEKFKRSSR